MGAEIKSAFLTMLHVTPEYIVVGSNPEEVIVGEDESEIILLLRGYIAAKHTNRESCQRFAISWNQAIRISSKDHLYRENSVMASESLRPTLLSRVTKYMPK